MCSQFGCFQGIRKQFVQKTASNCVWPGLQFSAGLFLFYFFCLRIAFFEALQASCVFDGSDRGPTVQVGGGCSAGDGKKGLNGSTPQRISPSKKKKKNCFTKPPYLAPYNWKPGKKWGFKGDETVHVPFFSAHETPSYARNTPNYWESLEGKEGKKS